MNNETMTDFNWEKIIIIVFGGGGLVAGLISLLKAVGERYDLIKKANREQSDLLTTLSLENRRLDLTEDERNHQEYQEILDSYKKRVEDLKQEVRDLKNNDSMSRPIITRIYQSVRAVRRDVEKLDTMIFRLEKHDALSKQIENVKQNLDTLENLLP